MLDFRFLIRKALLSDTEIVDWVDKPHGIPNISVNAVTNAVYPLIIYRPISVQDMRYADDYVDTYEARWEVSLFSKKGVPPKITEKVDLAMRTIGFGLYNSYEFVDQDTKVTHVILKYMQTLDRETFESLTKGSLSF
ncbi:MULTISPECIES: hypothetical protein [unclassified Granulicatella]|uniref:hypothetical protein n=1 Tax=unclassified Granulicatella TaxID=2630493 RepID=UPI0010748A3A|nr:MULTISPECIES: hypothetical protein [unclassified Granulicatella]MBF0780512.1 hypothetical protein [Granulicatella sp. 19428wC4_WM01]TFU95327.1 hypothetical protein E4T68_05335 [Granulicatella sp. WM01]